MTAAATEIAPAPSSKTIASKSKSTAPQARVCAKGCGKPLSYNNTTGVCSDCQGRNGDQSHSKKTNGHQRSQHRRANIADPAHVNGNGKDNGNEMLPRAEDRSLAVRRTESRVDILLAAVPQADKARMLNAWIAGTL